MMWSCVSKEMCKAVIYQKFYDPLYSHGRFCFLGLDAQADYQEKGSNKIYGGDELMQIGLTMPLVKEDFHVFTVELIKVGRRIL